MMGTQPHNLTSRVGEPREIMALLKKGPIFVG